MRVLGIDLGLKRTGLAVSDEFGLSVRPLENLTPKSRAEDISHIINLVKTLEVKAVVLGYPILSDAGDEGFMAKRASGFYAALKETMASEGVVADVVLKDERGSSKEAAYRLANSEVKKKKRRGLLDSEVARLLVEDYLAAHQARERQQK